MASLKGLLKQVSNPNRLLQTELIYRRLVGSIDQQAFESTKQRCAALDNQGHPGKKYLNSPLYLRENIARALVLGLHRREQMNILDIGSGPGYFLFVCQYLGHAVLGLDLPGNAVYNELIRFFQVPRLDSRIWAMQPLPDFEQPFDLITAYSINFDKHGAKGEPWGTEEWRYFLDDVRFRLKSTGQLYLRFNFANGAGLADHPDLQTLFLNPPGYSSQIMDHRSVWLQKQ